MRNLTAMLFALLVALWAPVLRAQDSEESGSNPTEEEEDKDKSGDKSGDKGPDEPKRDATKPKEKRAAQAGAPATAKETVCNDRIDNDGDSVVDCGDADCESDAACKVTGVREQNDALCSDFIDNDGNGKIDCDDPSCQGSGVTACKGSWKETPGARGPGSSTKANSFAIPADEGMSIDQMIGRFGDADGERNDYTCSDGVDNDGDGRVDCADFGCRFDSQVTVCNPQPGFRVSVVAQIQQLYRIQDTNPADQGLNAWDTKFSLLQLRFLGPIGNIDNSFFLLNLRVEKTPRLSFAMFQLPIGKLGHFVNLNSGGGGLTAQLIMSASKHLLLEPAFFVYNAFEQGNGAAVEFGGPIDSRGRVNFRVFGGGGAGTFTGNVGGRFVSDVNSNYTWTAGAQFHFNIAGYYNRFDTPYIYNPVPLTAAILVGGKYDQRSLERYPAWNGIGVLKWWHFFLMAETYWKRQLSSPDPTACLGKTEDCVAPPVGGSWQYSYLVTLGALLWPRHLFLSADFGEYIAGDLDYPPGNGNDPRYADLKRQRDERQFRGALHWYAYEQTGLVTLRYKYDDVKNGRFAADGYKEQELSLFATYRF
jgi:hypothetical protein